MNQEVRWRELDVDATTKICIPRSLFLQWHLISFQFQATPCVLPRTPSVGMYIPLIIPQYNQVHTAKQAWSLFHPRPPNVCMYIPLLIPQYNQAHTAKRALISFQSQTTQCTYHHRSYHGSSRYFSSTKYSCAWEHWNCVTGEILGWATVLTGWKSAVWCCWLANPVPCWILLNPLGSRVFVNIFLPSIWISLIGVSTQCLDHILRVSGE